MLEAISVLYYWYNTLYCGTLPNKEWNSIRLELFMGMTNVAWYIICNAIKGAFATMLLHQGQA